MNRSQRRRRMKAKRRRLPRGLTVEQEAPDRWAVVHVVGPLMGGFTNVVYKARGATRNQAIAHYLRGGYAMDDAKRLGWI